MKVRKRIYLYVVSALLALSVVVAAVPISRVALASESLATPLYKPELVNSIVYNGDDPNLQTGAGSNTSEEGIPDTGLDTDQEPGSDQGSSPDSDQGTHQEPDGTANQEQETSGDTEAPLSEDEQTAVAAPAIGTLATAAYVTTEKELAAKVTDSSTDYILLDANITMSSYIAIPTSKTQLTIDGQGKYTLTQDDKKTFTSSSTAGAVYAVKNLTVVGTKDEGIIASESKTGAPTLVFENINYRGPQLIYNRYGRADFYGTNKISIERPSGANQVEEVGEVHGITVYGDLEVDLVAGSDAFFWMFADGTERPYITVANGGSARFTTTGDLNNRGFFYVDGTNYNVELSVRESASLIIDITGYNPLSTSESHRIESIYIGKNAHASFTFGGGVVLSNTMVVDEGAVLRMHYLNKPGSTGSAESLPLIKSLRATSTLPLMLFNKPKLVVLAVEPTNRAIFDFDSSNPLLFSTTDFNYWSSYAQAAAQGRPAGMWSSQENNTFNAQITLNRSQDNLSYISSNNSGFNAGFDPQRARVIQVGTEPNLIHTFEQALDSNVTTGVTVPNSNIYIDYAGEDDRQYSYSGVANFMGMYSIGIDNAALTTQTYMTATAVSNFIAVRQKVPIAGAQEWINVRIPVKMLFGTMEEYGDGEIISPRYEIENESSTPVQVGVAGFSVIEDDGINLLSGPDDTHKGQDLKLDLQVLGGTVVEFLNPELGATAPSPMLETLAPASTIHLSLAGTYFGSYLPSTIYRPNYSLVWTFTPIK